MAPPKKAPMVPKPSSSVLLVSPTNQLLLLHRVQTSRSFPSAHVFPGGNVSKFHDGEPPAEDSPERHIDGPTYRLAAVRETFEESGILLAHDASGKLLDLSEDDRISGRKAIHKGDVPFLKWLSERGGKPDVDGLIPFTRWITPTNVPRRFTTQMYIYFLPAASAVYDKIPLSSNKETIIPVPTHDGGLEHTKAEFLPAEKWLSMANSSEIILFPPQYFLLTMASQFLTTTPPNALTSEVIEQQRRQYRDFARGGNPPWKDVCISPQALIGQTGDGKTVLSLEKPGEGLEKKGRKGVTEYVVAVKFSKEGPRKVQVKTRKEVLKELKENVGEMGTAYSHHLQHLQTKKSEKL